MLEPSDTLFRVFAYFYTYFCKIDISTISLTHLETIFTLFDISKTHPAVKILLDFFNSWKYDMIEPGNYTQGGHYDEAQYHIPPQPAA